jgi:hypothetical protein
VMGGRASLRTLAADWLPRRAQPRPSHLEVRAVWSGSFSRESLGCCGISIQQSGLPARPSLFILSNKFSGLHPFALTDNSKGNTCLPAILQFRVCRNGLLSVWLGDVVRRQQVQIPLALRSAERIIQNLMTLLPVQSAPVQTGRSIHGVDDYKMRRSIIGRLGPRSKHASKKVWHQLISNTF